MRLTRFLAPALALAVALGGSAATLRAADAPPATAPTTGPRPVTLHKTMENMGKIFGPLSRQVKDKAQKESTLKLIGDLQGLVVIAKGIAPSLKRVDAAERDKAAGEYRAMMTNVLRELLSAEEQVAQDKFEDASETFAGIKKIIEMGHKQFKVAEEH